jgi:hypothetical protein
MFIKNRFFAVSILVMFLSLFFGLSPAAAFDPVGGPGGGPFLAPCPAGKFLIGVNAKTGASVDRISIICGAIEAGGSIGDEFDDTKAFGGSGGGPVTRIACGASEIIHGLGIVRGKEPPHVVVGLIIFDCQSINGAERHNLDVGHAPFFPNAADTQPCPTGQAVTGLIGRFGTYLDAVGVVCGVIPIAGAAGDDPCKDAADGDEKDMCHEHNLLRAKHGVPALQWDKDLAKFASAWVGQCKTAKADNDNLYFCHKADCGGGNPNGENLAWYTGSPLPSATQVVDGWYCEINVYDFDHPVLTGGTTHGCDDNPNKVDGHFTQVVWRDSGRLGCAKNTCSLSGDATDENAGPLWACEYAPPGNFNADQPGVLQSQVPRPIHGLVATPGGSSPPPRQTATAIISDVDLYDIPGGVGHVMGILRKNHKYPLVGCRADNWCQLSVGWVWGSFVYRSLNRSAFNFDRRLP